MEETQFLVQWDEHPTHLATRLGYLLEHQSLVDVTLMCNTHTLKVHRAVLAACSPYFERQLGNHPLIVLKDMKFSVLKSLVEFMYCGETSVSEENLTPLLEAAKFFEVKGLAAMTKESVRYSNNTVVRLNGTTPQVNQVHTPVYMRGSGSRGRGRGRGRPPLGSKVSSPTEPAQILLSLSGNQPSPQLYTTSRNVKIDPSVLADPAKSKVVTDSQPRRRGRRRSALNTAIRERILRDSEGSEDTSPLLSSLLGKSETIPSPQSQDNSKYLQTLKDFGLPTDVPILYDNGEGKLVKLTESALKTMMSADANVQFHIAEGSLQDTEATPSSSVPSTPVSLKKPDNTMCEMVFDKENKNFVIKETDTFGKEEEEVDQLNETDLESLKNGAVSLVESDPEAVVMFEVTDNKKIQKCVLSAKDVNTLRVLNEQLSKQKSQLASMTNGLSAVEIVGNAQVAELKLKIHNTTSVLAQIVEKVQGLKNIKELSTKMLGESSSSPPKAAQQSQVVQLEFIDGNGEKIEGYQVEGTVVENKMDKKREDGGKESDLMCLLDMVCDENDQSNLISEEQDRHEEKERDMGLADDATDSLMGETEGENNYLVMNNHHLGQQNMEYENIEDMMTEPEHNGTISMENKAQDRYIIDNDGNIINQDESYVVYHDVKEEMASNEYVIYDGAESVLPDITASNTENFDEGEEDSQARNEEDCSQEYIVYRDENKAVLSDEIKPMSPTVEGGHYIVYSDENPDRSQDSITNKPSQVKTEDFVMFGPDKITEDDVDSLLDKPAETSQTSELLTLKDPLVSFTDDRRKKCKDSSELIHKRRSSSNSDSSDKSIESKKQKLTLQDDIDSS